jgi:hypothetical protein
VLKVALGEGTGQTYPSLRGDRQMGLWNRRLTISSMIEVPNAHQVYRLQAVRMTQLPRLREWLPQGGSGSSRRRAPS